MKALISGIIFGFLILALNYELQKAEVYAFEMKVNEWAKTESGKEFANCTYGKMIDPAMKQTFRDLHHPDFKRCTKENVERLQKEYAQANHVYFYEKVIYLFR